MVASLEEEEEAAEETTPRKRPSLLLHLSKLHVKKNLRTLNLHAKPQ